MQGARQGGDAASKEVQFRIQSAASPCVSGSSNSDLKWLHTEEIKFRFKVARRDVQGARQGRRGCSK